MVKWQEPPRSGKAASDAQQQEDKQQDHLADLDKEVSPIKDSQLQADSKPGLDFVESNFNSNSLNLSAVNPESGGGCIPLPSSFP